MQNISAVYEELPFDKYQRYWCAARVFEQIGKGKPLRIIDIGGSTSPLQKFLPKDNVIAVDLVQDMSESIILGDAHALPLKDKSADICCGIDFLEHIPEATRHNVLDEMFRVSTRYIYISGPFQSGESEQAEKCLRKLYKSVMGQEHQFLEEHSRLGLPTVKSMETWFKQHNLKHVTWGFNPLEEWILVMVYQLLTGFGEHRHNTLSSLNRRLNEQFGIVWNPEYPYVSVYLTALKGSSLPKTGEFFRRNPGRVSSAKTRFLLSLLLTEIWTDFLSNGVMGKSDKHSESLNMQSYIRKLESQCRLFEKSSQDTKKYVQKLEKSIIDYKVEQEKSSKHIMKLESMLAEAKTYLKTLETEINAKNNERANASEYITKIEKLAEEKDYKIQELRREIEKLKLLAKGNMLPGIKL